ncbi:hypothetical protein DFH09DRAFT_550685 [Mycena vulgaris]|nr:hypothetical protein DFH09DRAFT_550685 [Mycena vulgaris]
MFSKVLALGLAAFSLVHAAALQTPMVSCGVSFGESTRPTKFKAFARIEPGRYKIFNVATETQLRNYQNGPPIFVSYTREPSGPFGEWDVQPARGSDEYTIINVGLQTPAIVDDDDRVISGGIRGQDTFTITPTQNSAFIVSVPNDDKVWTVDTNVVRSPVELQPQMGKDEQAWRFVRIDHQIKGRRH